MNLKRLTAATALLFIGACETSLQTTSGADYLARYDSSYSTTTPVYADVDEDVRRIASIEPNLSFPARIGLARIEHGRLTALPEQDARIWQAQLEKIGRVYGDFVPVSPMIAEMVSPTSNRRSNKTADVIAHIRRGAARQHLDYVLAYEVGASRRETSNALAFADLTIIGLFVLPSRTIDVEATASGLMLDVRTGYPYATLTTHADKSGVSRAVSERSTGLSYADTAKAQAVSKLAEQFSVAIDDLAVRAQGREDRGSVGG